MTHRGLQCWGSQAHPNLCGLAETLGIAQQTIAHYEGGVSRIAVETLAQAATALGTSVEELIGAPVGKRSAGKRGPQPKIAQQLEQIRALPVTKQRMISQMIDSVIAAHQ